MVKEMEEKIEKEYLRRVKLLARSKLYAGNLICGINAWAIGVVRYTAGILDWTEIDLKKMDVKTRKILSMAGSFTLEEVLTGCTLNGKKVGKD